MPSHVIPSHPTDGPREGVAAHGLGAQRRSDQPIQFMGTHQSRLDAKGRLSVPAPFRAALRSFCVSGTVAGEASLILRPSHNLACIEGWPAAKFETLAAGVERIDLFSEDQDDLATSLYADAWPVEPDKEGRIVLPESLVQHAGLSDSITFMGLGSRFQIWEPAAAAQRKLTARQGAATRKLTVPGVVTP